jgi:colanic acid biosynthesis glycosyl transferase WcaI
VRVLVLAQYYFPDPIPKPAEVAEELQRRGHQVSTLTGLPNYPSGELAPGYRIVPWLREIIRGVPVLRVFEFPYHGTAALGRLINYVSFALAAVLAAYRFPRPDVVYVWHPPLTVGVAAWLIGAIRRTTFVYDVQDIWPDEAVMSGLLREGRFVRVLRGVERFVYGRARHLLVVTDGARANLLKKGVPSHKISVLPHWLADSALAVPTPEEIVRARAELHAADSFIVTFAGNLGLVQGLETVLDAAAQLMVRHDVGFRFIGEGSDRRRLEGLAKTKELRNVRFLGPRPSSAMPALLAASDALLVHAAPGPLNDLLLPTKTLAYLAAGRPVIAAMRGATADLIREANAGLAIAPGDAPALATAIALLHELPTATRDAIGERGRRFVTERFQKNSVMDQLETILVRHARRR